MKPKLRYYPVTLFKTAAEVWEDSGRKCSRNFGFRVAHREKCWFSDAIALIRCILRIDERMAHAHATQTDSGNAQAA